MKNNKVFEDYKIGDKVIFRMEMINLTRLCVGKITKIWGDLRRIYVTFEETIQFPLWNKITWNNTGFTLDENEYIPYTEKDWKLMKTHAIMINEAQQSIELKLELIDSYFQEPPKRDKIIIAQNWK